MTRTQKAIDLGNQPASPIPGDWGQPSSLCGLTKREYFAGLAMQGLLAYPEDAPQEDLVTYCIKHTDKLLEELAKDQP